MPHKICNECLIDAAVIVRTSNIGRYFCNNTTQTINPSLKKSCDDGFKLSYLGQPLLARYREAPVGQKLYPRRGIIHGATLFFIFCHVRILPEMRIALSILPCQPTCNILCQLMNSYILRLFEIKHLVFCGSRG